MNLTRRSLRAFAILIVLSIAESVSTQPPERVRVLVKFRNAPNAAVEQDLRGQGADVSRTFHIVPAMAMSIPAHAVSALAANPNVTVVEVDGTVQAVDLELDNTWGVKHIGAGPVHAGGNLGAGVKVAIIDSGIDCTHPDLDGNCMGGIDFVNDDNDPSDDLGHGTHVAGTVAAENDGAGVVGVAPQALLYGVKVLDSGGSGNWSDIIAALEWAVDNGIQVTNNSYGASGYPGTIVEEAFASAYAQGVLHIASAGNSGNCSGDGDSVGYPGAFASVVAVAATNSSDARACFSSTGPMVEISAPGVNILSASMGGGYHGLNGTSMASPHVAGVAALVIASGVTSNVDVRARLVDTANDLGALGHDPLYGFGLVDAAEAASNVSPPNSAPTVTLTEPVGGASFDSTSVITFTGTASDPEDGDLTSALQWTSDIDGPLGSSGTLSVTLSEAVHTVQATVTDSGGASSSESVQVTVSSPAPLTQLHIESFQYANLPLEGDRTPLEVTLRVVAAANQPVDRAKVIARIRAGKRTWKREGRTDSNGYVTLTIRPVYRSECYTTIVKQVRLADAEWDDVVPANQFCR